MKLHRHCLLLWPALAVHLFSFGSLLALISGMALAQAVTWDGPTQGPPRQPGTHRVVFIAQDLHNGGISGVYRSFALAAAELGWKLSVEDGQGNLAVSRQQFARSVDSKPDAIILGGFQPADVANNLPKAQAAHIVLVGWHAGNAPGAGHGLFANITTDPQDVAFRAVEAISQDHPGKIGAIIINDGRFDIANLKTEKMKQALSRCGNCRLLEVVNIPINLADSQMPSMVEQMNARYGLAWTHTLAINDVYFDAISYPLLKAGRSDIRNVSAGDGSSKAINRIRTGMTQQMATLAEPLGLQGWQLADEINRALAGEKPSGYVSKPILVTREWLQQTGNDKGDIDGNIPYRHAYRQIWQTGQ